MKNIIWWWKNIISQIPWINNVKVLTFTVLFSVLSLTTPVSSKGNKTLNWGINQISWDLSSNSTLSKTINHVEAGQEFILSLLSFVWEVWWKAFITKDNLNLLYDNYEGIKSGFSDELDKNAKKLLYEYYYNMLKSAYDVNWHKELELITERMELLSTDEISIKWWKSLGNPDFTEKITVKLVQKWDNLVFEKTKQKDKNKINIVTFKFSEIIELHKSFISGFPSEYKRALDQLESKNKQYLDVKSQLDESKRLSLRLQFQIQELEAKLLQANKKYWDLELSSENKAGLAKEAADTWLQSELDKLQEAHNTVVEWLKKDIWNRNTAYDKIVKDFIAAKNEANQTALDAKINADSILDSELDKLQEAHDAIVDWLKSEMTALESELKAQIKLVDTKELLFQDEREGFEKAAEKISSINNDLENTVTKLNLTITELTSQIENKDEALKWKQTKIEELLLDKQKLISDARTNANSAKNLLNTADLSLKDNDREITKLDEKIVTLKWEIKALKEEKREAKKIIDKVKWLEKTLSDYKERWEKIKVLQITIKDLESTNKDLVTENKRLEIKKESFDKAKADAAKSNRHKQNLSKKERDIVKKDAEILELEQKIIKLEDKVAKLSWELKSSELNVSQQRTQIEDTSWNVNELSSITTSIKKLVIKQLERKYSQQISDLTSENKDDKAEILRLETQIEELKKSKIVITD